MFHHCGERIYLSLISNSKLLNCPGICDLSKYPILHWNQTLNVAYTLFLQLKILNHFNISSTVFTPLNRNNRKRIEGLKKTWMGSRIKSYWWDIMWLSNRCQAPLTDSLYILPKAHLPWLSQLSGLGVCTASWCKSEAKHLSVAYKELSVRQWWYKCQPDLI